MKKAFLKIGFISLLIFILIGTGCKKEDNLYFNSLIGKWRWLYTTGGIVIAYPREGIITLLEFTKDGRLIQSNNDSITFETKFRISGDTLKYYHGTDMFYKIKIQGDTLGLIFIKVGFNDYFKRNN
jgi:hypothetical protein